MPVPGVSMALGRPDVPFGEVVELHELFLHDLPLLRVPSRAEPTRTTLRDLLHPMQDVLA